MTFKVFCDICGAEIPEASEGEGEDVGVLSFHQGLLEADKHHKKIVDFDHLCDNCVAILTKAIANGVHACIQHKTIMETPQH